MSETLHDAGAPARTSRRQPYRLYGLRLEPNLPLPGLEPADPSAEGLTVEVNLGFLPEPPAERLETHYSSDLEPGEKRPHLIVQSEEGSGRYHFAYKDGPRFVVDAQQPTVWGDWPAHLRSDDAVLFLLGPILGFFLRLRRTLCLHAGAVAVDGRALALAGPSSCGKSTLTTILARCGHDVLTDDVLPVSGEGHGFLAHPGCPRLRLRADVVERLFGHADARPLLTPNFDRRSLDLGAEGLGFRDEPLPLGAIFVLQRDDDLPTASVISALAGHEAVSLLAANTYRNDLLTPEMRREEFPLLAELARAVPVRRIRMSPGLEDLEETAARILQEWRSQIRVQP